MKSNIIVIPLLLLTMMLITCVLYNLERRLDQDIRVWYDQHWIIMEYPVSKSIYPKGGSERMYFLRLPLGIQKRYIEKFWDMREIGMQEEYALRIKVVERWFRGEGIDPWNTDMGKMMLLLGQPFDEQYRDQDGNHYNAGEEQWNEAKQPGKRWFRYWLYWHGQGFLQQIITVTFEWDGINRWRYLESTDSLYQEFIQYKRWRMAPTPEGWELWRGEIK